MANANNVDIQQQLNKLLVEQKQIMRENTRSLREQAELAQKMVESLAQATINNAALDKSNRLQQSLKSAAEHAKNFGKQSQDMSAMTAGALKETDNGFEGLIGKYGVATKEASVWGAAAGGFVDGISKGFNILKTGLTGVISLAGSAVQGMFSIGKAILAIPFKVFNAFINEANRMQGEPLLAREFEETRKSFGDFGEDLSKHVIQGYKNLRGELAETGLSTYRVLGFMHERLKFVREQFEALGPVAHVFGLEIAQQAEHFAAYQKGLGLSGDMMKSLAQKTQGTGDTFEETLRKTTNFTTSLGKQFGISQKVIGRDVGEMAKDLKTFGSVGVREMAQLSVYARKLGADFKDLLGIVEKFDNFEDAAEGAARLAQAFGLNIDAMDMIAEQDVGKRIDMVRKSFYQAGKDITKLTRQERNYLAQSTGIADQALNSVFALDKQGQSYDDIAAAGQTAEQQQLTQAEAMGKLADSIERMIKSGHRTGGFFDRFVQGFKRGMRWSGEFRDVMINIKKSLWAAERAGRQVGRAFVKAFPGIKDLLEGMKDFFDPTKFKILGSKIVSTFNKFFKELGDPKTSKQALSNLLKSIKEAFLGMEQSQHGPLSKIIEGFKKVFAAIGQIALSGIKIAVENITKFVNGLIKFFNGDMDLIDAMKEAFGKGADGASSAFLDAFSETSKQLGGPMKKLGDAFMKLLNVLWNKVKTWFKSIDWEALFISAIKSDAGKTIALILLGPAFLKAIAAGLGKAVMGALGGMGKAGAAAGAKLGASMSTATAAAMAGLAVIAVAIAAKIGYEIYKTWKGINDEIANTGKEIKNLQGIMEKKSADLKSGLEGTGIGEKEIASLYNEKNELDQSRIQKLLESQTIQTWDQLDALKKLATVEKQMQLDKLHLQDKQLRQQYMMTLDSDKRLSIEKKLNENRAAEQELNQKIFSEQEKFEKASIAYQKDIKSGKVKFTKPEKAKGPMSTEEMFGQFEQAKQLKPKQIEQMNKNISLAKDLITKKGGIREQMDSIGKAFDGFDMETFGKSAEAIHGLGGITGAIEKTGKSKINTGSIESAISASKIAISALSEFANDKTLDLSASAKKAESIGQEVIKLASIPAAALSIATNFSDLKSEVQQFSKMKNVDELPVVKAIMNMIEASNHINKELSGLTTFNVKPKLENLGKVLGLKGSESLRIEHENFNVDINVVVELNPTKLADAIADTGKFVKSTKTKS